MAGAGQTTHSFTGDEANYSHDFQNQIAGQNEKVSGQYSQYATDRASAAQREAAYDEAFKNQTAYNDLMAQAEGKYGVENAKNTYQDSLRAIAATNQAMSALPSTVNANSNVVLNQAQRNAALGNQMGKYQNTLSSWQQQNAVDQSALNMAMQQAGQLAQGNYAQQQQNIANSMGMYQTALQNAAQTYNQALEEQNILRNIYAQMYNDEYQHQQQDYNYWYANLQDKWKQDELAAQRYAADAGMRVQQYLRNLQEQEKANDNSFENYLMSKAAYGGSWAEGTDKDAYLNDMYARWMYGDNAERQKIMSGSTYGDYLKALGVRQ